ncbi:MAG TPA: response regulator [Pseudolabrys sp.]|nr:response regulator [Pseudolabrys sp.]
MKVPVIAIIDDDEQVRDGVKNLVRSLGYTAAVFSTAEEYLLSDCIRTSSCVVTDLRMPGISGAELQKRLIAVGNRTPVIFMTAFADDSIRANVLNAGAAGFLKKPFDDKLLVQCLENALGGNKG